MNDFRSDAEDSPYQYFLIGQAYSKAAKIIIESDFLDKHPFHWSTDLRLHPLSHLLGMSLEVSLKGILKLDSQSFPKGPKGHDLEGLLNCFPEQGKSLCKIISKELTNVKIPRGVYEANPEFSRAEIAQQFRSVEFHVRILNNVYSRPYATRYPVNGVFSLPDPLPTEIIVTSTGDFLRQKGGW